MTPGGEQQTAPERAVAAGEIAHAYGPRVHLLDNLLLRSALARVSSPDPRLTEVIGLVRCAYEHLLAAAAGELASIEVALETRMAPAHHREGVFRGTILDPSAPVVVCDVIRAGLVPAQVCFERLLSVLPDEGVRLDHLNMSRVSDAQGRVSGVDLSGSKVGGSVEDAVLLIPDPMGATGSTVVRALEHYVNEHGTPRKVVCLPMIATPEFLRCVLDAFDELVVYTARLDRGLSPPDVLAMPPGAEWERECGLNEQGYIVPGAGGIGELLNNAWC
ncbi:MAG: uracil phosphoribosyltransferase [Planctomycetota bacterium]|nr:uracil phosphoribosyltransferase [Planctomycetota bacterium]MDP6761822.1 uracil phosphoribosyltransferase [Planctomycetota bacterium]MDP6988868.1 uracil phosphoribosyltransferase [Planctomycetota bacterium]